jgi:hypothetical protein
LKLRGKDSWGDLLRELKSHGLTQPPKLATGDGSLGFWIALQEEFGTTARAATLLGPQDGQRAR